MAVISAANSAVQSFLPVPLELYSEHDRLQFISEQALLQLPQKEQEEAIHVLVEKHRWTAGRSVPDTLVGDTKDSLVISLIAQTQLRLVDPAYISAIPSTLVQYVTDPQQIAYFTKQQMEYLQENQLLSVSSDKIPWIPLRLVEKVTNPRQISCFTQEQMQYIQEAQLPYVPPDKVLWIPLSLVPQVTQPDQMIRFTDEQKKQMTSSQLQKLPPNQQREVFILMIPNRAKPKDYRIPDELIQYATKADKVLFLQWISEDQLGLVPCDMVPYIPISLVAKITLPTQIAELSQEQMRYIVESQLQYVPSKKAQWIPNALIPQINSEYNKEYHLLEHLTPEQSLYMSEQQAYRCMSPNKWMAVSRYVNKEQKFNDLPPWMYKGVDDYSLKIAKEDDVLIWSLVSEAQMSMLSPEIQMRVLKAKCWLTNTARVRPPDILFQYLPFLQREETAVFEYIFANMTQDQKTLVAPEFVKYVKEPLRK